MEILIPIFLAAGVFVLNQREQQQRIVFLSRALSRFDIEKLMENLIGGYFRALGEASPEREAQVWQHLKSQEETLCAQVRQFSDSLADVWGDDVLVSTLPIAFPRAHKFFPRATFDLRKVLQLHAIALQEAAENAQALSPKDRAFVLTAELLLLQHTCHWYCRSKRVASARLLVRHQTTYEQVLASVAPATRLAYHALTTAHQS